IVKALADKQVQESCRPLVIGDVKFLRRAEQFLQTGCRIEAIASPDQIAEEQGVISCLDMNLVSEDLPYGHVSAEAGNAAFRFLEKSIALAREGLIDAICTAPLNKE